MSEVIVALESAGLETSELVAEGSGEGRRGRWGWSVISCALLPPKGSRVKPWPY